MFDTLNGKIFIEKAIHQGSVQVENFPPISVIEVDGQYVVRDGNSRLLIAQKTKAKKIKVIIETALDACRDLNRRLKENGYKNGGSNKQPKHD